MILRRSLWDELFVASLHQAIAPVIVASLAVEDGLNYDLFPAVGVQCAPELLLLALIATFGTKKGRSVLKRPDPRQPFSIPHRFRKPGRAKKLSVI